MAVRDSYRDWLLEQLGRVRPVRAKRMFGGLGLYADEVFFGVVDNDTVFFRTGDATRASYESRGMEPFQPMGPGTKPMSYHEVPADVLEDPVRLSEWLNKAVGEAALATATKPKPKPGKRSGSRPGPGR
jgi:DNA transformation protein and related proteins